MTTMSVLSAFGFVILPVVVLVVVCVVLPELVRRFFDSW